VTQPPSDDAARAKALNAALAGSAGLSPADLAQVMNGSGFRGALAETMGIELLEVSPAKVVARMPVAGNTQPYGILHGGATVVLAETVGSLAAAAHAGPEHIAVGVDVAATHHRAPTKGHVTATATPLHAGRTIASYLIDVMDDDGRRTATARLTCYIRPLT